IVTQLQAVQIEISGLDKRITQIHRTNADSRRLDTIPGFGVILSTAVVAMMTDPKAFRTGREFAAWIGLVPRQNSTGGKKRLGSISKQGDRYLRRLLVVGATSVINSARARPYKYPWVIKLLGRLSLRLDVGSLDDRPPLLCFSFVEGAQRIRRLLLARRNFL